MQVLTFCKKRIYELVGAVTSLIRRYKEVRANIPRLFASLMRCKLQDLEATVQPGLTTVLWTSLASQDFIASVNAKLDDLVAFVKEVSDMKSARVDATLEGLSETVLVWLPPAAVSPKEFEEKNKAFSKKMALELAQKSAVVEGAVKELIDRFADVLPDQFGEERYRWLDSEKAARTVSSQTKLTDVTQEEGVDTAST